MVTMLDRIGYGGLGSYGGMVDLQATRGNLNELNTVMEDTEVDTESRWL